MGHTTNKRPPLHGRDSGPDGPAVPGPNRPGRRHLADLAVSCSLLLAIAAVFGQTIGFDFTDCDDPEYVCKNPQVTAGVTAEGIVWAFTHSHGSNWHPLTSLSHMLDCRIYGLDRPGGHHLTNILLHAAGTILLFLFLRQAIHDLWASAFAAALFAVHPLHVESVAWVSERKDVLSGLLFMLTLIAYCGYACREFSLRRYLLVTVLIGLGLMAKPMLVTLPFVLLLLDYWPLGRIRPASHSTSGNPWRHLLVEKLPWLLLAAVCSAITLIVQRNAKAVVPLELCPVPWRIANAVVAYTAYLVQFFVPTGLAVLYPHPGVQLPIWKIAAASVLVAGISVLAVAWRRKHPYLLVGWLWYLGMLVPVIGLVQVGGQAMADRYTYLTQIGLYVALALGIRGAAGNSLNRLRLYQAASWAAVAVLAIVAWRQASYWRDTETLLTRAVSCTSGNITSHRTLAAYLERQGRADAAIAQHEAALALDPDDAEGQNRLGMLLASRGRLDAAIPRFTMSLKTSPEAADTHNNLGLALARTGQNPQAVACFQSALRIRPQFAEAHDNLGTALLALDQVDAAMDHYRKAMEIKPGLASAHNNLGFCLARRESYDAAIAEYRAALTADPDFAEAHNNLGNALAARGEFDAAIAHYRRALALRPDYANARENLSAVLSNRNAGKKETPRK